MEKVPKRLIQNFREEAVEQAAKFCVENPKSKEKRSPTNLELEEEEQRKRQAELQGNLSERNIFRENPSPVTRILSNSRGTREERQTEESCRGENQERGGPFSTLFTPIIETPRGLQMGDLYTKGAISTEENEHYRILIETEFVESIDKYRRTNPLKSRIREEREEFATISLVPVIGTFEAVQDKTAQMKDTMRLMKKVMQDFIEGEGTTQHMETNRMSQTQNNHWRKWQGPSSEEERDNDNSERIQQMSEEEDSEVEEEEIEDYEKLSLRSFFQDHVPDAVGLIKKTDISKDRINKKHYTQMEKYKEGPIIEYLNNLTNNQAQNGISYERRWAEIAQGVYNTPGQQQTLQQVVRGRTESNPLFPCIKKPKNESEYKFNIRGWELWMLQEHFDNQTRRLDHHSLILNMQLEEGEGGDICTKWDLMRGYNERIPVQNGRYREKQLITMFERAIRNSYGDNPEGGKDHAQLLQKLSQTRIDLELKFGNNITASESEFLRMVYRTVENDAKIGYVQPIRNTTKRVRTINWKANQEGREYYGNNAIREEQPTGVQWLIEEQKEGEFLERRIEWGELRKRRNDLDRKKRE